VFRDAPQAAIVFRLVINDMLADVEHRQVKQVMDDEEKDVDDPTGAPVAIEKGMNGFELVMRECDFDQGIHAIAGIKKRFEFIQFLADDPLALGWRVDDLPCLAA
jgi:hypothetical protein